MPIPDTWVVGPAGILLFPWQSEAKTPGLWWEVSLYYLVTSAVSGQTPDKHELSSPAVPQDSPTSPASSLEPQVSGQGTPSPASSPTTLLSWPPPCSTQLEPQAQSHPICMVQSQCVQAKASPRDSPERVAQAHKGPGDSAPRPSPDETAAVQLP